MSVCTVGNAAKTTNTHAKANPDDAAEEARR